MKKVPLVLTLPFIRSSKVIATEHPTALKPFYIAVALVSPTIPATRVSKIAIIKNIVGQYN